MQEKQYWYNVSFNHDKEFFGDTTFATTDKNITNSDRQSVISSISRQLGSIGYITLISFSYLGYMTKSEFYKE